MRNIKRTSIVAAAIVALLGGGVAFAAWTSTGTGTGTATATSAKDLTVTVQNVPGLYPTGSVSVPFTVTNPNPYAVKLSNVHLQSVTTGATGCDTTTVTGADLPDTDLVAAGATSASRNFILSMSNAATDQCQGASFTVTLLVSGASN
jgi:hypothetical protein